MAIEDIFSRHGEEEFRRIERETLETVARSRHQVVSTGGGIIMDERNRAVMDCAGVVVLLEARPDTLVRRLRQQEADEGDDLVARPMLDADDLVERIHSLKAQRQFNYTRAHWTVHTDFLSPTQAAEEVVRGFNMVNASLNMAESDSARMDDPDLAAEVRTSAGDYPLWVGWQLIDEVGERIRRIMDPGVAYIITDEGVYRQARRAQNSLEMSGIAAHLFVMPSGEQSKTLATAQHIYVASGPQGGARPPGPGGRWWSSRRPGRIRCGDVSARPSVRAGADEPAGDDGRRDRGKTAVDLPQGKNLVGAFYQPKFVLADVSVLQTLPERELRSGWAEAIKHGLIMDDDLLSMFESQTDEIQALEPEIATDVIRRSMAIKANVVSQDERETLGIRVLLNYGHTIGHGIEAATGYGQYLHGEAVSIGMMGAANIGRGMGLMSDAEVERQQSVLAAYGLPLSAPSVDSGSVLEAMRSDKKVAGGAIRWVLLDGIGNAITRNDVTDRDGG